jgi:cytochrome c-type biogenesis protein CcmF
MGFGDTMLIGPYKIVCQSFTQDSNKNYDTEFAVLDAYKYDKKITTLNPEKRFYNASGTFATMVANHTTLQNDLYVIYEGKNPDTDKPIIKVFINPLIVWIWIGVVIVAMGTLLALVPAIKPGAARTLSAGEARTAEAAAHA